MIFGRTDALFDKLDELCDGARHGLMRLPRERVFGRHLRPKGLEKDIGRIIERRRAFFAAQRAEPAAERG